MRRAQIRIRKWGGADWCITQPFPAGDLGGAVSPPAGSGAEPGRQTNFGNTLLQINLKSGLFSVAVYTPNSDPISDVHWLIRHKIGSAVRGCAKLVDIRMLNIENDYRLVTSITGTTCPRWRLLSQWYYTSSSSHGGATSSALAHLDH